MQRKNWSEEQIIGLLRQAEHGQTSIAELCRAHNVSQNTFYQWRQNTFYQWRQKYGSMQVNEAKRLRQLEAENARLKRLLAESQLDIAALQDVLSKKW